MSSPSSIAYYHLFKVSELGMAGGRVLTARQQSVVFYHLGHTGISTTQVPDLDTSLTINGSETLSACHAGQDGRQSAHPAASMIAGASLSLSLSAAIQQYGQSHAAVIITASEHKVTRVGISRSCFFFMAVNSHLWHELQALNSQLTHFFLFHQ